MKNYDIIFFDIDDTLFDFGKGQNTAFRHIFEQYDLLHNYENFETRYKEISAILWRELEEGKITLANLGAERFRKLFAESEIALDAHLFNEQYLQLLGQQTHLIEGAEEVLKALSHKRLAVMTNGFATVQTARINSSPLKNTFEQIIISETTGFQKPQKEIFDYAFRQLDITDKSNVLIVGDSLTSDMQGGLNYGIDTCWFNPQHKENNTQIKPTYEISSLRELLQIVQ